MVTRRRLIGGTAGTLLSSFPTFSEIAEANDLPGSLTQAKDQLYNFIIEFANGQGVSTNQKLVLNSLIMPLDLSADTPYYNEEMFRQYADRTFSGGVEGLHGSSPASQAERFSFQYKQLISAAASRIDRNHPEIQNSLDELNKQLNAATTALGTKLTQLDGQWQSIATARNLKPGTNDYELQRITWQAQVRYGDQIGVLSDNIDDIDSQIDGVRRGVYTVSEAAVLDNISVLGSAYNVARPWHALTEIDQKTAGAPLTDIVLADVNKLAPSVFDSSPLILPVGNLQTFLTTPAGFHGFDTGQQSSSIDAGSSSWFASGGGSFLGWSLGGGGSGSSSFNHSMSQLNAISLNFANIAEYIVDRSAWFNSGVLLDPNTYKLVEGRRELANLQYVAVGLIIVRGTNLQLRFSQQVNSADWSQSSWDAGGGGSFLGFGFSAGGGGSNTHYTITHSADWTSVNFVDDPSVTRVIGVRVEPFLVNGPAAAQAHLEIASKEKPQSPPSVKQANRSLLSLAAQNPALALSLANFKKGQETYAALQAAKLAALRSQIN